MSKHFQNENEKNKEIKETSKTESYDDYENETMENAEEGAFLEEILFPKDSLPTILSQTTGSISSFEKDTELKRDLKSSEEKKRLIIEKWFSITGKKPKNIPTVRKYYDEEVDKITFFGDRKSEDQDKKRAEKLFIEAKRLQQLKITYGKVQEIRRPACSRGLQFIRFAPNNNFLAEADLNGSVQIRHCSTGEVTMNLDTIEQNENVAVNSVRYFPGDDEKLYLGGQSGVIQIFNPESGELLGVSDNLSEITVMDINSNGSILATGGKRGILCTVDPFTLQTIRRIEWPRMDMITAPGVENEYHKSTIYALKFHPTETHLFVTGACDNSVKIWDVRIPKAIRSIRGPAIFGEGVDVLDDEIITASWRVENSLSLWNFSSGRLIKSIPIQNKITKYESEFLYCAQFFKDSSAFASSDRKIIAVGGSGSTELLVINVETGKILAYFPSFKSVVALDISGNLLAYGGKESIFRIGIIESKNRTRTFIR